MRQPQINVLIIIILLIIPLYAYSTLLSTNGWINYLLIGSVILVVGLQFNQQKREAKKQRDIKRIEGRKKFEAHYAVEKRKYEGDENVTFEYPYINFRLNEKTIPLLPIDTANTEQLLLLQKEHLQITCDLISFRQHIAFIKANGKYSANFYKVELPQKIGLGLWQFPKGKDPAVFPVFVKRQIIAGNIYVWNMESEMYETEMGNAEVKTSEGSFITQNENYCCGGIEFFKYPSCFY